MISDLVIDDDAVIGDEFTSNIFRVSIGCVSCCTDQMRKRKFRVRSKSLAIG